MSLRHGVMDKGSLRDTTSVRCRRTATARLRTKSDTLLRGADTISAARPQGGRAGTKVLINLAKRRAAPKSGHILRWRCAATPVDADGPILVVSGPMGQQDLPATSLSAATPVQRATAKPSTPPQAFLLTGGGSGIGKTAYSGCTAHFVADRTTSGEIALDWCTVKIVALGAPQTRPSRGTADEVPKLGDEINWSRRYLRALLPGGTAAKDPPTWEELAACRLPAAAPSLQPDRRAPVRWLR